MNKETKIYYSADSDDAFMFWALKENLVDTKPFHFTLCAGNTEDLNTLALQGEPDVCAVSMYAYGFLADVYLLFPHGGSVGRNYGPVIVSRKEYTIDDLPRLTVATPGEKTTAHAILRMLSPESKTTTIPIIPFDRIFAAIDRGDVDAGLLIHEGRLIYGQKGYNLIADIGSWWFQRTGHPLPLGGTVIRKSLGEEAIRSISSSVRESIRYALDNREMVLERIMREDTRGQKKLFTRKLIDEYLFLYANADTLDYGDDGRKAIQTFLDMSYEANLLPTRVRAEFSP
ncbi:MAG: ABC transporter substrate-binding protein [Deltaproteobacteria bacterium]|nr:ABC transporter substrate-binding protein [Deltaproteobacteria bacterium]